MADIDPYGLDQQYTPRGSNIVDAIAETKRITEAALRANPLRNARIDDGLMQWRGNYAGGVANSGAYLWLGEFSPSDNVLKKPQRGFILTRDDPNHTAALWMYDPDAGSRGPGNPLRQRVIMRDADNKSMLVEGRQGGLEWPWFPIPMYPAQSDNPGNGAAYRHAINGAQAGTWRTLWHGAGPMVGPNIRWKADTNGTASQNVGVRFVITWDDNTTFTSGGASGPIPQNLTETHSFAGQDKVGRGMTVELQGNVLSGPADFNWIYPVEMSSFG